MKIIRYLDASDRPRFAAEAAPGEFFELAGTPFGPREITSRRATVAKLLAPIEPRQVIGIGLNYRHHAAETGLKEPEFPVVFFKSINSVQHPGDPIVLPGRLAAGAPPAPAAVSIVS